MDQEGSCRVVVRISTSFVIDYVSFEIRLYDLRILYALYLNYAQTFSQKYLIKEEERENDYRENCATLS